MNSTMNQTNDNELFVKGNLCPSCLKNNDVNSLFCKFCNASLSLTSNPDPIQRLSDEGYVYSKAVEGKPKPIVLIGVWIIFAPLLIFSVVLGVSVIFSDSGTTGFLMFWLMLVTACFSFLMVYRVTKNFIIFKKEETEDN